MSEQPQNGTSEKILERVRGLLNKAISLEKYGPGSPEYKEAQACREMADSLMLKYAIDQAMLDKSVPAAARQKPMKMRIQTVSADSPLRIQFASLAMVVARHTRCKCLIISSYLDQPEHVEVFGFESDVRYFDMLFTSLMMQMSGVFFPRPDETISFEQNLIELRALGMNWLDMAGVYGWEKQPVHQLVKGKPQEIWRHRITGQELTNYQIGGRFKRDYHRAADNAGIPFVVISSAASRSARQGAGMISAAQGYIDRIGYRLRSSEAKKEPGTALVLKDRMDEVEEMYLEFHPKGSTTILVGANTRFDEDSYSRGSRAAERADLGISSRVGGSRRGIEG